MRRIIYLLLVVAMMTTTITPASAGNVHVVAGGNGTCTYDGYHDYFSDVVWTSTQVNSGPCTKVRVEANIKVDGSITTKRGTGYNGYVQRSWGFDVFNWTRHTVWSSDLSSKSVWKIY